MSTRTTRSRTCKTPTDPKPTQKKLLLNTKKPIKTAEDEVEPKDIAAAEKSTEHYVLTEFKHDKEEQEDEINFILSDKIDGNAEGPLAECTEEIVIDEEVVDENHEENVETNGEDIDNLVVKTQEIVEHICGKCFKSFRTVKALKRHIAFCLFSADLVSRRQEMLQNIDKIEKEALHMHKKDICFCCGDSYDTCHGGHINCLECPKTFKTQLSLERHTFLIHSEDNAFPCSVCNGKIRTAALLELHMDQHMTRGKPFACKTCGKDFTRQYHLKRHLKFSTCAGPAKAEAMVCKVCGKEFVRVDNFRTHLKSHLGQGPTTKKSDYMCPCCKKCFYSLSTLNIHIRTHTGERPFDCDLCDKNFPSLVALKKHRRFHTGEKPYTCSVCNTNFAVKEVLNRHMKRHTGEKPHSCDECHKRFIQATQLKNHLRTHLRPFPCPECPEKFKTERQLEKHSKCHKVTKVKTERKPSERTEIKRRKHKEYNCEDCNLVFKTVPSFLRHELSEQHAQNAKKQCQICGIELKNLKSLQFHNLKYHEISMENESTQEDQSDVTVPPPKLRKSNEVKNENEDLIIQQYVIEALPEAQDELPEKPTIQQTIILPIKKQVSPQSIIKTSTLRSELRESLAECLRDSDDKPVENDVTGEEIEINENVGKLLDMLVDAKTLKKFGWPKDSVEKVLCKVIENCGYNMEAKVFTDDYCTRMREYVKLLFTVVIQNNTIKELLNNYPIDEVIEFVLSRDNDNDDDEVDDNDNDDNGVDD